MPSVPEEIEQAANASCCAVPEAVPRSRVLEIISFF